MPRRTSDVSAYHRRPCPTASPGRPARTCSSTRTTRSTGSRGAPTRSPAAKLLDRPIFLSIGYAACHWCHVMERESFEHEPTAALPERPLRRDQGRSRGAARPRPGLHGGRPGDDRRRRLADVGLPDARGPAVLRRDLLPGRAAPRDAVVPPGPRRASSGRGASSAPRSRRPGGRLVQTPGRAEPARGRRGRSDAGASLDGATAGDRGRRSTRRTAAGAGPRSSRSR